MLAVEAVACRLFAVAEQDRQDAKAAAPPELLAVQSEAGELADQFAELCEPRQQAQPEEAEAEKFSAAARRP